MHARSNQDVDDKACCTCHIIEMNVAYYQIPLQHTIRVEHHRMKISTKDM